MLRVGPRGPLQKPHQTLPIVVSATDSATEHRPVLSKEDNPSSNSIFFHIHNFSHLPLLARNTGKMVNITEKIKE